MARTKGSKDYPLETKLEAIRLKEEEGLLYREITEKLDIRDPGRVKAWMRIYREEGTGGLKKPRRGRPKKDWDSLEARINLLINFPGCSKQEIAIQDKQTCMEDVKQSKHPIQRDSVKQIERKHINN